MTPKILLYMEGGVIHAASSDGPVEIYVADFDIDGIDEGHPHLTRLDGEECLLFKLGVDEAPHSVSNAEKTWRYA